MNGTNETGRDEYKHMAQCVRDKTALTIHYENNE